MDDNVEDQETPEEGTQEKRVTVNEDPDVFQINPDTTEVSPVPPVPLPRKLKVEAIGPSLDLDKIISETVDIIKKHQISTDQQKHALSKITFMLSRVKESVELYSHHIEKLSNFLFNNDLTQSEWYYKCCKHLPAYGDYNKVLKNRDELVQVDGVPGPLPESELKKIVDDVVNNFYAGGAHIKTQQTLTRQIESEVDERRELCAVQLEKHRKWLGVFNVEMKNQEKVAAALFEVSAYVDFLKDGGGSGPTIGKLELDRPALDWSKDK